MALICLSCAWIAGIFLGSNPDLPPALILAGIVPLPMLFFFRQHRKVIILASLSLIALLSAAAYSSWSLHKVDEDSLRYYNQRGTLQVRGMVADDPEIGDTAARLSLSVTGVELDGGWQAVRGTALVFVPRYPAYEYGDVLLVTGRLEMPSRLNNFDYEGYLARRGIYTTIRYPKVEVQGRGQGFKPLQWAYSLRHRLARVLAGALPEPQASLAQGIILGIRSNIPAPVKADFYRTGTTHILAISGMNLTIVAGFLLGLGIWLFGRRYSIYVWFALATIWSYSLLTGMQPPVVRAAIMASLFLAAELLGRQRSGIIALVFAAAIMVGLTPYVLWDVSFQLSFVAMAGLVFVFPALRSTGRELVAARLGEDGAAVSLANLGSDSLAVTLAATIAVWPLVAYYFGIIAFIGAPATLLVLPALPGIIITGGLTAALGLAVPSAAPVAGWFAWPFLTYMLSAVSALALPSLSSLQVGPVNAGPIWTYYLALATAIGIASHRQRLGSPPFRVAARLKAGTGAAASLAARLPAKWVVPPLLVAAIVVWSLAAAMPDDRLHVSFLNVGEGDAILIQKGNRQVLVDGGPSPQAVNLELATRMPFWNRSIDLLVSTHPHSDHLAGLVEVLQRFQVRQVLSPDLDYTSSVYDEWRSQLRTKNIERTAARAGQEIDLGGGAIIRVLYPLTPAAGAADLDNESLVLRLSLGSVSFLLTADTMEAAEMELVRQRADLASTVLKVAHHGSATSTSPGFLAVVVPQVAVVSVGAGNRAGHPNEAVMARLAEKTDPDKVYRTDQNGTIEFITDGERLWVKTGR